MDEWHSFIRPGDEWFVNYSLVPARLPAVVLFSIGQAVELYLKAANAKLTGDTQRAIRFSHNISGIIDDCREQDPHFMGAYTLLPSVLESDFLRRPSVVEAFTPEQLRSYGQHRELYQVAKLTADLKYLGTPLKVFQFATEGYAVGYSHPNGYWITFVKRLRRYLGWPLPGHTDFIKLSLEAGDLPRYSAEYLERLYEQ